MSELTLDLPPAAAGGRSGGYDNINIYNERYEW